MSNSFYAMILAGGRGTRFWPLSRRNLPKQCLSLDGGPTLVQRTVMRLAPDIPPERVLVVTGPDMAGPIREQLNELPSENILVEPSGRNTAPCVAWAAVEVERRGGSAFAVLPSDHYIGDEAAFRGVLRLAQASLGPRTLCTLGIRATRPETGFGWIEAASSKDAAGDGPVLPVRRFVEKPSLVNAQAYLAAGYLWNAGMFVWRTEAILDAITRHMPGTARAVAALRNGARIDAVWSEMEATSIDYGVMERAEDVVTIPVDFGWSDLGSWPALEEVLEDHGWGVGPAGAVVAVEARSNIVHAPGRLVALLGVDDLVIVDTGDVVLVARKDRAQDVRHVLAEAERQGLGRYS